jgi:hypothetical protein
MSRINKLKKVWEEVYSPDLDTRNTLLKYFHPEYSQCINGVLMDRDKYIDHVIAQKKGMNVQRIDYLQHLEQDNRLFALYYPRATDINDMPVEAEVIVYVEFQGEQIYKIQGQVRLIQGDASSVDMTDNH